MRERVRSRWQWRTGKRSITGLRGKKELVFILESVTGQSLGQEDRVRAGDESHH